MRTLIILIACLNIFSTYSQVGIKTQNPKGLLHIDGTGNNPRSGAINNDQASDDLSIRLSKGELNLGIGTIPKDESSCSLELGSSQSAFLPNRVTLSDVSDTTTVSDPVDGMIVYNTTNNQLVKPGLYSYYDNKWNKLLTKDVVSVIEYRDLWVGSGTSTGVGTLSPTEHSKAYEDPSHSAPLYWANPTTGEKAQQYITLPESGSFAFSFRMYMKQSNNANNRAVMYLWAMKGNSVSKSDVYDAAELNVPTYSESNSDYQRMTVSVTLTVTGTKGDLICFRFGAPVSRSWPHGNLVADPLKITPQKTTLFFWKL